jgi:2-isopropylmalate synthase
VADTVGHATPVGASAVVKFVASVIRDSGAEVGIDWHGHRDRDLAVINSIAALEAGATRLHGAALGIGERVGNTPMDLLLVNLVLLGMHDGDLTRLGEYCEAVSSATGVAIPANYPVLGEDAFRTGTGVHAAAIVKAKLKGDNWLADRVYSSIPASLVGRRQRIEISHVSGMSNVKFWLAENGYDGTDDALCRAVFELAKRTDHVLSDDEVHGCCHAYQAALDAAAAPEAHA